MKSDINLAKKQPVNKKAAKSVLFTLLFLAALGALFYAGTAIPQMIKAGTLFIQADLNKKLASLSEADKKFEEGTLRKKQLIESVAMLKELEANKKDIPALLSGIEAACPEGVTLTGLLFNPDTAALSGLSNNDTELASFVSNLKAISGFKSILVNKTESSKGKNKESFVVTLTYTAPLGAEPIKVPKKEENKDNKANSTAGQKQEGDKK